MTDDTKKVKVSYKEYPSGLYGHDFDLTTIQDDSWQKFEDFLERHGLSEYQRIETEHDKPLEDGTETHYQYVWHNPEKTKFLATANNPVSGKYRKEGARKDEIGYASYMSIEAADPNQLALMVLDMLKTARHVKDHGHAFTNLNGKAIEELGLED